MGVASSTGGCGMWVWLALVDVVCGCALLAVLVGVAGSISGCGWQY